MGKVVKWLGVAVLAIVLIVAIGAGILMALLDESRIKLELAKAVKQSTGGELAIDGALGLSIFPQLGVSVEQLHFTPKDQADPLATIDTLQLGVDFMPLFSGQVNVGEITLKGLQLNMVRNKAGVGNWENLTPGTDSPATETTAPEPTGGSATEASAMTLAISQLRIADTQINYIDQASGETYKLSDFRLDSQGVNLSGGSFPASIGFTVNTGAPVLEMQVKLDTQLSGDLQAQILELQGTKASIVTKGEPTSNIPLTTKLATNARVDLQKGTASLQNLKITMEQLHLSGKVEVSNLSDDPKVVANLQSEPFNPRQLAATLQQPLPEFTNDKALTQLRFASDLTYSGNRAEMKNVNIVLDQTQVNGTIAITDLAKQALLVKLKIDQLNLDDYQVVIADNTAAPAGEAKAASKAVTPLPILPVDTVKALDLDATLNLGKLTASGLELTDIAMKTRAKNGLVDVSNLSAKLYEGSTNFSASVDVRPKQPQWKFNGNIAKVQIAPLLAATSEIKNVEGTFDFDGQLSAQGNEETALKKSLKGPGKFSLSNGVVRQINLDKTVCQAIALINSKQLSKPFGPDTTLQNINGTLQFGDGRINNTELTGGLTNTKIKGSGYVGMLDNTVDYRIGIQVVGELEEIDPACEVNERYRDIYWPVRCKGSLDADTSKLCTIDSERVNEIARKMAEKEIKTRASDAVNDALKRFLNR
jgi:AsmA protein